MKKTLLKILRIFLLIAAALLTISLIFGVVLALDWPLWVGLFLVLIVVGLVIGGFFLKRIWMRRREKKFVQQVIEQDQSHLKTVAGKEKDELQALQNRWKEAIATLQRSHLKKYGNPLYVLPWYLVIGESGTGKTTAITSARLSSPFAEMSRTAGISGTRNCDWWFFEQAVIIDTVGRYAIPIDEGRDKEEWQRFLELLSKYRKKEPLNGLIVTVAADKLLEALPALMEEDGRNIRRRIDELMRVLGAKFPVYVLVTKCDLIQGMNQFSEQLPEKSLQQPMGVINQDLSKDVSFFLNGALDSIGERLRNLRILLLHKPESKIVDPGFLLFPEEFEHLRKGLETFMKAAFQENPYQETPILRGLFFSSGRQEGSPYSHFLQALGLIGEKEVLPGTNKGLFLHDLFAKILPKDRGLFAPTTKAVEWSSVTRNLGLISWIVITIALCGILSFSFVKNLRIIREVSHTIQKAPTLQGELLADLIAMDHFRQAVLTVEERNRNWWIPRFGLTESRKVEEALKEKYCTQFETGFLNPFDKQLAMVIEHMTTATADEVIGEYMMHIVRRINLLKARIAEQSLDTLQGKPQPFFITYLSSSAEGVDPEMRKKFGSLYLYYLLWRSDTGELTKQVDVLQTWLKHLLSLKRTNFQWLVNWVNSDESVPQITLGDFWGGSLTAAEEKIIPSAFTHKGKELIDVYIKEFEAAVPDPLILTSSKTEFEKWYRTASFAAWQIFAEHFSKGVERLNGMKEWQQVAEKTTTGQGPYASLLNTTAKELEPLLIEGGIPAWLQGIYQLQAIKTMSQSSVPLEGAKKAGQKFLSKVEKMFSKTTGDLSQVKSHTASLTAYQDYQKALSDLSPVATSRNHAFQVALQTFSEDRATGKSPFYAAQEAAARLQGGIAKGKTEEAIFSKLLNGPVTYLWAYTRMEAACSLQSQWEEKVISETQGATEQQAIELLIKPDGSMWNFVKGPAAPFIGWSIQKGYYAKDILGGALPFQTSFFTFLSKGAKTQVSVPGKQNYPVSIKGIPTDVNPDAKLKPHSTHLELQCETNTYSLTNLNYPVSKTFIWAPNSCTDVTFQVEVGDIMLTQKYAGAQAFPEFLKDFQGGHHTFYPDDFPEGKAALEKLKIKYIKVNYQFSGEQQVLGQLKSPPGQVPIQIIQCWE